MIAGLGRTMLAILIVMLLGVSGASAQAPPPQQLDQLLAPIALYPDPLLSEVLMAATYPLEVVEADRWVRVPDNAALRGPQLAAALELLPWDPSVKSLVAFPQVLHMMNGNLDWTERLGNAFLADQAAVMDGVQRLRHLAMAAGKLDTTAQQTVTNQGPIIEIEPAGPDTVYVPVYSPLVVYGAWPYPDFAPYYFPGYFPGFVVGGIGFGWFGVAIVAPLWGWGHCDWRGHRIDIDRDRFAALNLHRPPIGGGAWEHDPSHRHAVPYGDAATREHFHGVAVSPDMRRSTRGFPTGPAAQSHPAPTGILPRILGPPTVRPPVAAPTIESYGRGADVRSQAQRGQASRMSTPSAPPRAAAPRTGSGDQRRRP